MPRHSDLAVNAVNILAPQPGNSDISLESSNVAHSCCIYSLHMFPVSHSMSTVGITDITNQAKKHSPAWYTLAAWNHSSSLHCTTGHLPIQLTFTNTIVSHPIRSHYGSSMVYHPESSLHCSNRMIYNILSHNHHICWLSMMPHCNHTPYLTQYIICQAGSHVLDYTHTYAYPSIRDQILYSLFADHWTSLTDNTLHPVYHPHPHSSSYMCIYPYMHSNTFIQVHKHINT
jgi:hypothetical protein